MMKKTCSKCGLIMPTSEFYKGRNADGLHSWCKTCFKQGSKKTYEKKKPLRIAQVMARDSDGSGAQRSAAWRLSNPERYQETHREGVRRRRARLRGADVRLVSQRDLNRLLGRFRGLCAYCPEKATEWDHVIPVSRGGRHAIGNLLPCCGTCNRSKNFRLLVEWRPACTSRKAA